jgi:copper chaperone
MENVTLNVKGMSCGHCVKAVEGSVGELGGVSQVKVNLENGTVDVEFNNSEVTLEQIKESIDDQGYDVAEKCLVSTFLSV